MGESTLNEEFEKAIQTIAFLWDLIDDIDSQSDVCKSDDVAYRKRVEQLQAMRWKTGIISDGYSCKMPNGRELPERTTYRL